MTDHSDPSFPPELRDAQGTLADVLRARLGALVQGAAEDVERYAAEMSADLAFAASTQDERALRHLTAQAKNLGEKHRLRASDSVWAGFSSLAYDLGLVLAKGLAAAAGGF